MRTMMLWPVPLFIKMIKFVLKLRKWGLSPVFLSFFMLLDGAWLATAAHAAPPYGATQCAASRFGSNLGCNAKDVSLNTITVAGSIPSSCVGGQTLPLDLDVTIQFLSPTRYNIGVFVSSDGKNPQLLPASGGASACSIAVLPTTSPFLNLDGGSCGDGNGAINGGTGAGTFRMYGTNVPCTTDGSGNATLSIPYLVSWDQNSNANACSGNTYPAPGTTSKCNTGTVSFPPGTSVIVLPAISITDGVTTTRSGNTLTYTVVITNTTASALSAAVFTDPVVANLSVSSVSCTAAGGASCPASSSVLAMQGSGITLPPMPNNSSLTFTVVGTVGNPTSPTTLTNTAQVTVSGQTNSASDTDTVMVAPTVAKSFSPSAIASGGTSTLTITLTNPNAVAITGAAFTDTYPSNMQNTTPLVLTNSCGGSTPAVVAGGGLLSLSGGAIPASGSCAVSVLVRATATVVNSTGAVISSNAATSSSASATLSMIGEVSSFNAFETSTTPNPGAISGLIYTKLASTAFGLDLDVVAITGGIHATGFSGNVKVELLANTGTAGSGYGANNCPNASSVIQTIASSAISGGRSTVNFAAVAGAYRDVRVRISYPTTSPTVTTCSSDSFAIRPQSFTVTSSNANADDAGLSTVAATVVKAGSAFALTATAVAGYSTTPLVDSSKLAAHTGAVQVGLLGGSFGAAAAGTGEATGSFTYSEVGYFNLAANGVYDDTFTAVDASPADCTNDFSNTLVGGKYGCKFGNTAATNYFGRFVPDHFALTPGSLIDRAGINTGSSEAICASLFTYMGEDFKTTFTLTAQNSVNATTQNYTGGHAIFGLTTWSNFAFTASSGTLQQGTVAPSGAWSGAVGSYGTAAVTTTHKITRPASPTAPHTAFSVSAQPTYTDSTATIALAASTATHAGTSEQRFGRLRLSNGYGSELLDLPIPVQTQFWNGTAFVTNSDDNCTTVASSRIGLSNYQKNLNSGETGVSPATVSFASGIGSMKLTKPGAGNSGSADLCVDLGPDPGGGTVCAATSANLPFLQGKWPPGTNLDNDPTARATFGIYKSPLIYRRENY